MRQLKNFIKKRLTKLEKCLDEIWKIWGKGGLSSLLYIYPAAQLPTNDTIKVLHKKVKEEYDKARTAWEEGGRKAWGSRKADMDNKRDLLVTITTVC